jgi:transcriptional regulator with XRE-family HTH domain
MTLVSIRQGKGISQRALAEKSGMPQALISRLESGTGNPTLGSLKAYAGAIELPVSEVVAILCGEKNDSQKLSNPLPQ